MRAERHFFHEPSRTSSFVSFFPPRIFAGGNPGHRRVAFRDHPRTGGDVQPDPARLHFEHHAGGRAGSGAFDGGLGRAGNGANGRRQLVQCDTIFMCRQFAGAELCCTTLLDPNDRQTNSIQDVFFLTRLNQTWTGIGYRVFPNDANGNLGTLYRYSGNNIRGVECDHCSARNGRISSWLQTQARTLHASWMG